MKIICIGDSNTYGYDPRTFLGGRYAKPWPEILGERSGWDVRAIAENGREIPHSEWDYAHTARVIRNDMPADLIIVMLGTNDLLNIYKDALQETTVRMQHFIRNLKKDFADSKILLLSPLKIVEYNGAVLAESVAIADRYESIAAQEGILFADTSLWKLPLAYDGLHLAEEGHLLLAESLEQWIRDQGLFTEVREENE